MDPRIRANEALARARARSAFVVTPDIASSPMDASSTVRIPREAVNAATQDPDSTMVIRQGSVPDQPGARQAMTGHAQGVQRGQPGWPSPEYGQNQQPAFPPHQTQHGEPPWTPGTVQHQTQYPQAPTYGHFPPNTYSNGQPPPQ